MIKLIASDLDGTLLLHGSHQLSLRALSLICRLQKQDVIFTAASGRQYPNLYRLFGEAASQMAFICENGAYVVYQGQVIQKTVMEQTSATELIWDIYNREGCEVLISGECTSYVIPKNPSFLNRIENILKNNVQVITSLGEIPEDIIKVSAYEEAGIMEHSADYFISRWQSKIKCTVSGFGWLDFVHPQVNKGTALTALLDFLHISPDDTAAFGDNYNDLEMLSAVKYGYVMEHAADDIRKHYHLFTSSVEDSLEGFLQN